MPVKKPWIGPTHLPDDLAMRLEHEWARLNLSLGHSLPKATFVRMLLERGAEQMAGVTLSGSEGVTVLPSLPDEGLQPQWDPRSRVALNGKELEAIARAWAPIRERSKHSQVVKERRAKSVEALVDLERQLELRTLPPGNYRLRHTEESMQSTRRAAEQSVQEAEASKAKEVALGSALKKGATHATKRRKRRVSA